MLACNNCKLKFNSRIECILHKSSCGRSIEIDLKKNKFFPLSEESDNTEDEKDDSDIDPTWCPSGDDVEGTGSVSPIPSEHLAVAKKAEKMLISDWNDETSTHCINSNIDVSSQSSDSVNTNEETSTHCINSNIDVLSRSSDSINTNEDTNIQSSKKKKLYLKLKSINLQIEEWKEKRKLAVKMGQSSKARRLSQNIKKCIKKNKIVEHDKKTETEVRSRHTTSDIDVSSQIVLTSTTTDTDNSDDKETSTHCINSNIDVLSRSSDSINTNEKETKKRGGRRKNFCLYCKKLVTNLSRHLETQHPTSEEGEKLLSINITVTDKTSKRLEKQRITTVFKNKSNNEWNAHILKQMENEDITEHHKVNLIPVKYRNAPENRSGNLEDSVNCTHCHGLYKRNRLAVHIKNSCKGITKTNISPIKLNKKVYALKQHSVPLVTSTHVTDEMKSEILNHMNSDYIATIVKSDPLILQMGSDFHKSRRHESEKNYVSREMRDMARLLIQLKKLNPNITKLQDCFNPVHFGEIIRAVEILNGYDPKTGSVKVAGLAYRLLQPLQHCLRLHRRNLTEQLHSSDTSDRTNLEMVNDFIQLIKDNWANQLGINSLKSLKRNKTLKIQKIALEEDIKTLCKHILSQYERFISHLKENPEDCAAYDQLTDLLLAHIMCLVRRRPVDLTRGTLEHYNLINKHDDLFNMIKDDPIGKEDLDNCKKFHIFFVPGKKYENVPVVLTEIMKLVMDTLISCRISVGINTNKLFVHSSNRVVDPAKSLERIKRKVKLTKSSDLTGNGLRHQAATFSKLHSNNPHYQDHLATTLGHSLFIHKKNYDLPTSVSQKTIVLPVLHKMTTSDISSKKTPKTMTSSDTQGGTSLEEPIEEVQCTSKKPIKRKKWSDNEKHIVYKEFGNQILNGLCPPRQEIVNFQLRYKNVFRNRTTPQLVSFINNCVHRKIVNVSPDVKRLKRLENQINDS